MSPRNATENKFGQRFYQWKGERYYSVTTILSGGLPKPALFNWAKLITAQAAVDQFATLKTMVDSGDADGAVDWLKRAADRARDKGANLGSAIHAAIEATQLGRPMPELPVDVQVRVDWFNKWVRDFQISFAAVEASVYSRSQHYAGTMDCIVQILPERIGGEAVQQLALTLGIEMAEPRPLTLLVDYKSNKKGIFPETAQQCVAYKNAEFIAMPDGSEEPMPAVDACAALWLQPDGGYEFIGLRSDDVVYRAFLFTKEQFRWQEETKKTALLGPLLAPKTTTQEIPA